MRPNGSTPPSETPAEPGWSRVTSMARWLARRRQPATSAPRVSVVMPVYNAASTLAECLTRLFHSNFLDFEVVVVDDGSTDQSRAIATNFPVNVVPSPGRVGPAAARNVGARAARGDILFFIDSDVMVAPDTLTRLVDRFGRGDVDGLVGVQSAEMRHRNLPSQYKNLWMRWTYSRKRGDVPLFYTTAAAIRREAFLRTGGFDESYSGPNVEDQAYGNKLARLGIRVRIQPDLEVEHVKRYSIWGLLKTDFIRSMSLVRLKLRDREDLAENNTSIPVSYMVSVPLSLAAAATIVVGVVLGVPAVAALGVGGTLAALALNVEFLATIHETEGWLRTIAAVPLLWLELLVVAGGICAGLSSFVFGRRY